jgi:GNAT superfamily N-acetyltransferase
MPVIRQARPADNAALLELVRKSPMQADMTLLIERAPDFFALARARGAGCTLVAEQEGSILGCVSVAERSAVLGGAPSTMRVVCDLRTLPERRRQGIGQGLIAALADREGQRQPALYVAATAGGNRAVEAALGQFGRGRPVVPLAAMVSFQLFPLGLGHSAPLRDSGLDVAPAATSDDAEVSALLTRFHRSRTLAPVYEAGFAELSARSPGLERSDVLLARRHGRLVAALGLWDPRALKQTRVLRVAPGLRLALGTARALRRVLPLLAVPEVGKPLAFRYLRPYAHELGEEAALRTLIHRAVQRARTNGDHFALFTCAVDDPVRACVSGFLRLQYHYQLVGCCNRPEIHPRLLCGESTLFYDDAALA